MMRMSECPMIELHPRDIFLNTFSHLLRLYPVFLRASLIMQRFVQ
jgi:hypothetical protein